MKLESKEKIGKRMVQSYICSDTRTMRIKAYLNSFS